MHGMYDPLSAWKLARFARRWRADVLHGQAQRGGRYADWASRWSGVPAVASANSMVSWRWFRPQMRLLAVSHAVRDHLVQHGLPAQQVEGNHGLDTSSMAGEEARATPGPSPNPNPNPNPNPHSP